MDTHLPDFVLAQLFKNSLVITDSEPAGLASQKRNTKGKEITELKTEQIAQEKKWWLGDGLKNIVILIEDPIHTIIEDSALEFLTNILVACHLGIKDIVIINYHHHPKGYMEIKKQFDAKTFLLFGVNAAQIQLNFTFPFYQPMKYDNCQFILSPKLNTLMQNTPEAKKEKGKLWVGLKNAFQI